MVLLFTVAVIFSAGFMAFFLLPPEFFKLKKYMGSHVRTHKVKHA